MYRIVAIDSRSKRDGKFLEDLGTYNPRAGTFIHFRAERIADWVSKGAILSDTVKRLQKLHKKASASPNA